jgi:hypothetical protein
LFNGAHLRLDRTDHHVRVDVMVNVIAQQFTELHWKAGWSVENPVEGWGVTPAGSCGGGL